MLTELQRTLLTAICSKSWRGEPSLCRQFDKNWRQHTEHDYSHIVNGRWRDVYREPRSPEVEDALFALVRSGHIEWFGGGDQGFEPLKYKGAPKGLRWFAAQNKHAL